MQAARSSPGFWAEAAAIKKVKIRSIVFKILVNWVGEGSAKFEMWSHTSLVFDWVLTFLFGLCLSFPWLGGMFGW